MIDHVLDALDDDGRAHVLDAVEASLRPGGVVAVTYRTAIGWAEIAPIVRLLRYMVTHHGGPLLDATSDAVRQLVQLREAGAKYLNARPVVRAWLDELAASPPNRSSPTTWIRACTRCRTRSSATRWGRSAATSSRAPRSTTSCPCRPRTTIRCPTICWR